MTTSSPTISSNPLRAGIRLLMLAAASVVMLPLAAVPIAVSAIGGSRARFRVIMALTPLWGRVVAFCCGMRLRVEGRRSREARVFVGNHVGYMDIVVASVGVGGVFVSRHDVKDWPLMGLFARLAGTVFIDRSSIRSAIASSSGLAERARQGIRVALFPEGATSSGERVREFKPFLFASIVADGFIVQPFSIRYTHIGGIPVDASNRQLIYWYDPAPPFHVHGWRMLGLPSVRATIRFHDPARPPSDSSKESVRAFAEQLHARVNAGVCGKPGNE